MTQAKIIVLPKEEKDLQKDIEEMIYTKYVGTPLSQIVGILEVIKMNVLRGTVK